MATVGQFLTPPQAMAQPPAQPATGIGGLLSGIASRGKGIWNQVGTDPATTRAAQVLALSLLQGGGNWKRNLGQGGMAALSTFEGGRGQEKATKEKEAAQAEDKRRYDLEQSNKRAQDIIANIYRTVEYKDRAAEMQRNDELRKQQLELDKERLGIERTRAWKEAALSDEQRLEAAIRKGDRREADIILTARAMAGAKEGGKPVDYVSLTKDFFDTKMKMAEAQVGVGGEPPDEALILAESAQMAAALGQRMGGGGGPSK